MPDVYRAQIVLDGWTGGPGVNTLWFTKGDPLGEDAETAQQIISELQTVYDQFMDRLAPGVTAEPLSLVDKIDEVSGSLLARYGVSTWKLTSTTSAGQMSRATQAKMRFVTNVIWQGRVLQGGPFIGPLAENTLTNDGAIGATTGPALVAAWGTFLSGPGPRLAVYSQPKDGQGRVGDVSSVAVKPRPAVLRSRRD